VANKSNTINQTIEHFGVFGYRIDLTPEGWRIPIVEVVFSIDIEHGGVPTPPMIQQRITTQFGYSAEQAQLLHDALSIALEIIEQESQKQAVEP
jgi:hypothetical protein